MKFAEQVALVCDYLRSKTNPSCYLNDAALIPWLTWEDNKTMGDEYLDTVEAMNYDAIGERMVRNLVETHLKHATKWKQEQREAA